MKTLLQVVQEMSPGDAWTGIGSRRCTDEKTLSNMTLFAELMSHTQCKMRSGAADNPDTAFENGTPQELREIFIHTSEFGRRDPKNVIVPKNEDIMLWMRAGRIAEQFHVVGRFMDGDLRGLMSRNVYQVLGRNLKSLTKFVICDAPGIEFDDNGLVKNVDGGTGMAVRLAYSRQVPVFVMSVPEHMEQVNEVMNWLKATYQPNLSLPPPAPQSQKKPYQPKLF